jgi:serine/arginine repetitive matrix protein 2
MYNGIGLNTARGSGTNGYVQTNVGHVKDWKVKKADGFLSQLDIAAPEIKEPNRDILDHEKKRKVESKVYEYRLELEEKDLPEEKIEELVNKERAYLLKKLQNDEQDLKNKRPQIEEKRKRQDKEEYYNSSHRQGHMIKEAQLQKNDRVKEALGIKKNYKVGDAFNFKNKQNDDVKQIEERSKKISDEKIKELMEAEQELKLLEEKKETLIRKKVVTDDMDILLQAKKDLQQLRETEEKNGSESDKEDRKRRRYDSSDESE